MNIFSRHTQSTSSGGTRGSSSDGGSIYVGMALALPVLFLLITAIAEYGNFFSTTSSTSQTTCQSTLVGGEKVEEARIKPISDSVVTIRNLQHIKIPLSDSEKSSVGDKVTLLSDLKVPPPQKQITN